MDQLGFLYPIIILLVVGIFVSFLCNRFRLPLTFFLLLAGVVLSKLPLHLDAIPRTLVVGVSVFAIIMVTYDVFSRFKPHRSDSYSHSALQTTVVLLGMLLITLGAAFIAAPLTNDPVVVILVCCLIAGISAPFYEIFSVRVKHFLDTEVIYNEVFVIFLAALLMHFAVFRATNYLGGSVFSYMSSFTLEILLGIGAGLLVGLVVFKIFRKLSKEMTPTALLGVCFAGYVLAELLNASGVFAVLAMAMLFGGLTVKHKAELEEFSRTVSRLIEITVFMLLGFLVSVPIEWKFLFASFIVFLTFVFVRYLAISVVMRYHNLSTKERWILSLISPKGVVVGTVALGVLLIGLEIAPLLQVVVTVFLYSHITAWVSHAIKIT